MKKQGKLFDRFVSVLSLFLLLITYFVGYEIVRADNQVMIGTVNDKDNHPLRLRAQPTTSSDQIGLIPNGYSFIIEDNNAGKGNGCSDNWFKVKYKNKIGYVCSSFVVVTTVDENGIDTRFPESYREALAILKAKYPNWTFEPVLTNMDFNQAVQAQRYISYIDGLDQGFRSTDPWYYDYTTDYFRPMEGSAWFLANPSVIAYYMDPRNFLNEDNIMMFEDLYYFNNSYDNYNAVYNLLKNTDAASYANEIVAAAQNNNVNAVHVAARIKQEVIKDGKFSGSATGRSFDYITTNGEIISGRGVYNLFNIGAYPVCVTVNGEKKCNPAIDRGLAYAAGRLVSLERASFLGMPWDTIPKAIHGGTKFLVDDYIGKGQDTVYFQRFNVSPFSQYTKHTHQYMTNIRAPYSESISIYNSYKSLNILSKDLVFKIPVYNNMPVKTELPNPGNPNNYLKSITINGVPLSGFDGSRTDYTIYLPSSINEITIGAELVTSKASVTGIGVFNISLENTVRTITVTAQNGDVRNYNITIIKKDDIPIPIDDLVRSMGAKPSNTYLKGFGAGTTVEFIKEKAISISASADVKILDQNNNEKTNKTIGTGDKMIITANGETKEYSFVLYGDVNGDGKIDIVDLLRVQKIILNALTLPEVFKESADTNQDGKVDIIDLLRVQKDILGLIKI